MLIWNCTNFNIDFPVLYSARVYARWMENCKHNLIFKKGDCTNTSNYCPVSLTSICSKLLEHIIYRSIFSHLKEYNILHKEQHGFQSGKSCESQLIMTINDFANCLNKNSQMYCIFLESQKHSTGSPTQQTWKTVLLWNLWPSHVMD